MPMARLTPLAHRRLQELAVRRGQSHQQVLDEALELMERRQFFAEAHQAYAELRANPAQSAEFDAESALLEGTLNDGLPIE
jgi:predicted transcriptional regulator